MEDTNRMLAALARSSRVNLNAIRYGSRVRVCVHARQVAAWLLRNLSEMSYPEIGNTLGRRNHSGMMHSCKRVDDDIRTAGPRLGVLLKFIEATQGR